VIGRLLRAVAAAACALPVVVALTPATAATGTIGVCPATRCHTYRVPVPKGVHITNNRIEVILPVGYATSNRRYPVIYLFNGALGPYNEWILHTDIGVQAAKYKAIFVDMDGGDQGATGYWSDWLDGTYQWETWHIKTLIPWVDKHFRTMQHVRGAMGVSLGSTGALDYAEHNPGLFKSIATFSGLVDTQLLTPVSGYDATQQDPNVTRAWGDQTLNADVWAKHNPTVSAANLAGTHIYVTCGTGSPSTDFSLHSSNQEMDLFADQSTFLAALDANGVQHTDNFYPGGEHNWAYFLPSVHWALPQLVADLHH